MKMNGVVRRHSMSRDSNSGNDSEALAILM
jgi:hypothetical protein